MKTETDSPQTEEAPSDDATWRRLYWAVVLELSLLTAAFYTLTRWAS